MKTIVKKISKMPFGKLSGAAVRALNPSVSTLLLRDATKIERRPKSSREHLDATMSWLCRAQDESKTGGVCGGFSLAEGWLAPYPETTGYIIPTFYDYAKFAGKDEYSQRAEQLANWEVSIQMESGAVQAGLFKGANVERRPAVFNTGQVILGFCRVYVETKHEKYINAARKAGNYLVKNQSDDGAWRVASSETETAVHAYDVRTAWSLLEIWKITNETKFSDAAKRKIEWTLAQQTENGWFANNAFFTSDDKWTLPLTHTIAYVMEGLLESYKILGDERLLKSVEKTAEKLLRIFEIKKFMAGEFDEKWKSSANYACLTGNAQIAGIWLQLFEITDDARYLNAALKLNDYTKSTQNLTSMHGGIRGGVKGSQPIYGKYTPFIFVNWGAKFLADTLMLEESLMKSYERKVLGGEK